MNRSKLGKYVLYAVKTVNSNGLSIYLAANHILLQHFDLFNFNYCIVAGLIIILHTPGPPKQTKKPTT